MAKPREPAPSLSLTSAPPEAWGPARRFALKLLHPVEVFLSVQAASGIVLLVAAAIALIWANSPWSDSYTDLWHTQIGFSIGSWSMQESLHFWINDGLMTIFFLLVGLEIKREIVEGELSDLRRAALPIAAAIGGMIVPAVIFLAINTEAPMRNGWGVPMATDIAFAVGVLALLGDRVPAALRVMLLALAIIDDIGAILVIAVFYSSNFAIEGVAVAGGGIAVMLLFLNLGVRPGMVYAIPLAIIWAGLYQAGVHPTLAGVIVGLATPAKPWYGREGFLKAARRALAEIEEKTDEDADDHSAILAPLERLSHARREALAPAVRLAHAIHAIVAFGIMPLFALANAGVALGGLDFGVEGSTFVLLGIGLGLVLGKPIGILLMSWVCVRLKLARLPSGCDWGGLFIVGTVAGIGFTMAIFIAELAFKQAPQMLPVAKLAVLTATAVAAIVGLSVGRLVLRARPELAGITPAIAETSTEH